VRACCLWGDLLTGDRPETNRAARRQINFSLKNVLTYLLILQESIIKKPGRVFEAKTIFGRRE